MRWRIKAGTEVGQTELRVFRPAGGGTFDGVGTGATVTPTVSAISTFDTRLSIQSGDFIGIDADAAYFEFGSATDTWNRWVPLLLDGDAPSVPNSQSNQAQREVLVNADIEPDADGDGFGDETQDGCPGEVGFTAGCDEDPVAVNDSKTVTEDDAATLIDVLANDTDDGGTKQISSASDPSHGTVVVAANGLSLTYKPDTNYCGADSFTYTLNGGSTATVSITVSCVDDVVFGTPGPDVIQGTPGNDVVFGRGGNDKIYGNGGDDLIIGGKGNDKLFGLDGNDTLKGGKGTDKCVGGVGTDTAKKCEEVRTVP